MSTIVHHSSEIRYLCSVKWTVSETQVKHFTFRHFLGLQKLMVAKTHIVFLRKKSESLQTEGRHFRSMICKINDV